MHLVFSECSVSMAAPTQGAEHYTVLYSLIIGASVSKPHTSELNCNFSHFIIWHMLFRIFLALYFNTIAMGCMQNISKIFEQFGFSESQLG